MAAPIPCPACGAANAPGNAFCINCGRPLAAPGYAPMPTPPPATPPLPSYPPGYAYVPPYAPSMPPRRASVSRLLDGLFQVWSKNFLNFLAVYLGLSLVTGLVSGLLAFAILGTFGIGEGIVPGSPPAAVVADVGRLITYAILSIAVTAILSSIVVGAMTEFAVRRFRGEAFPLEPAFRRGLDRFISILGAELLVTLVTFALVFLPLLLLIPGSAFLGAGDLTGALAAFCALLGLLALGVVVAVYITIATILYAPVIMMENAGAIDALTRSWRTTKGHRWSLLGAFIVAGILVVLISIAFVLPAGLLLNPFALLIAAAVASGFVGSWFVILSAVAYDLITRQPVSPVGSPSPYFPGPAISPPPGAAQVPPTPPPATPPAPPSP